MTAPNFEDAERELQRVEESERNKMQDRTRAIVAAAEDLVAFVDEGDEQGADPFSAEHSDAIRARIRSLAGALYAPAPQWTRTPPSEPGWYWLRANGEARAVELVETVVDGGLGRVLDDGFCDEVPDGEWFPVRIEEPPA